MSDSSSGEAGTGALPFEEAVRNVVQGLGDAVAAFEELLVEVPDEAYTDGEWQIIERTAAELETAIEQAQLDYEMAALDSEAWFEVMKDLPRVTARLGEAILLMREARARHKRRLPSSPDSG
jgi:hypothetical protein